MRDIGRKIQRYRLSRYGSGRRGIPLRWAWVALSMWAIWAGFVSDHSFYHLWRLKRTNAEEHEKLVQARADLKLLEQRTHDPQARLSEAERRLREDEGWSRPNEIIYRIDDAPDSVAAPGAAR